MEVIVTARVAEFVFKGWCLLTRTSALSENFFIMSCSMKHLGQEGLGLIGRMLKEPCKDRKQFPVVFQLQRYSGTSLKKPLQRLIDSHSLPFFKILELQLLFLDFTSVFRPKTCSMKYGKGVGGQELCQFYSVNYVWIFKPSVTEFSRNKVCIHNEGKDLCVILIQFKKC